MPPLPKHSSERRRRNLAGRAEQAAPPRRVRGPALEGEHSDLARRWYEDLRGSRQAAFFEPSDWGQASLVVAAIDAFVANPQAAMLAQIHAMSGTLLVAEGDRRKMRLELERERDEAPAPVSVMDDYRHALGG